MIQNPPKITAQDIAAFYREHGLPEKFCPVPFSTLVFEANGNVCMCRQKGAEFAVGDIQTQTVEEIWNGAMLKGIREEFLSGNIRTCAQEIARDACNLAADHAELLQRADFAVHQNRLPLKITPNFNGRCNLECPMCHIWKFPNGLYDTLDFWPKLEKELLPHLIEIDTFSGEPFLQKDTYRLIKLAAKTNPSIFWSFTTNGNWRFNPYVREHLDSIEIKNFNFSIDTISPENYPKIRKNGDLQRMLETFHQVRAYGNERVRAGRVPFKLTIICVVQRDNWQDLPSMLAFRRETGALLELPCLIWPAELSLQRFDEAMRIQIIEYLLEKVPESDLPSCRRVFTVLFEGMSPIERARLVLEFKRRLSQEQTRTAATTMTIEKT